MFEEDFDRNFRETTTMEIFHKIKEKYLAKAAPENPLDGEKTDTNDEIEESCLNIITGLQEEKEYARILLAAKN